MLAVKIVSQTSDGVVKTTVFTTGDINYHKGLFNGPGTKPESRETLLEFTERNGIIVSYPMIEKSDTYQPMEYAVLHAGYMPGVPIWIFPKSSVYIMLDGVTVDTIKCDYL